MNMHKFQILLLTLVMIPSFGYAEGPEYCRMGKAEFVPLDGIGNYMRVHPSGEFVQWSGGNGTAIADLREKNRHGNIVPKIIRTPWGPEPWPVSDPTQNGDWWAMAFPHSGMQFMLMDDILKNGADAKIPRARDEGNGGQEGDVRDPQYSRFYHSIGVPPGATRERLTVRVLLYGGRQIRDMEVTRGPDGRPASFRFQPVTPVCANLAQLGNLSMVVITKDGSEFIGARRNDQTGQYENVIVKRNESTGQCTADESVGPAASGGKVDTTMSTATSKGKITWTACSTQQISQGRPSESFTCLPVVYDRDTKTTVRVPPVPGCSGSASYPGSTRDGRVIYQTTCNGRRGLMIQDLPAAEGAPLRPESKYCASCFSNNLEKYFTAVKALGQMWQTVCARTGSSSTGDMLMTGFAIDNTKCQAMVRAKFAEFHQQIGDLTLEQMISACPTDRTDPKAKVAEGG